MSSIPRKRSLPDMQHPEQTVPEELNDADYIKEVLQLTDDCDEAAIEEALAEQLAALAIDARKSTVIRKSQASICDSAVTATSRHARTGSTGSQASISTAMTSRSSNEQLEEHVAAIHLPEKRDSVKRVSTSEYQKFLEKAERQHNMMTPPSARVSISVEPAPSLHSVSTKKSHTSSKSKFKDRFRSRRKRLFESDMNLCHGCGDDIKKTKTAHTLPCSHRYCDMCLRALFQHGVVRGSSCITCRCKTQVCFTCGSVRDAVAGCPNHCNGSNKIYGSQEELGHQVNSGGSEHDEQDHENPEEVYTEDEIARSRDNEELNALRARQINERDRFYAFERRMKWLMWTRHGQLKLDVLERYGELETSMKDSHAKSTAQLEDRQVAAEMDLRATLKQSERSVLIRLRHMEAYCEGLGRSSSGDNPARVVTERDLRELGQQYNLRDNMERLHQSKINVLREKQSKQMDELLAKQEEKIENLAIKQNQELDTLEETFGEEEDQFHALFTERKARLRKRWRMAADVVRKRLEMDSGLKYARLEEIKWSTSQERNDELDAVTE